MRINLKTRAQGMKENKKVNQKEKQETVDG